MKKIIFACILFFGFGLTTCFAQSEKLKEKAAEKVELLNAELVAADKTQGLTAEQKETIFNLHIERLKELRQVRKDGGKKEESKVVNQKYNQKIYKEILTKKQKQARKAAKEKTKD